MVILSPAKDLARLETGSRVGHRDTMQEKLVEFANLLRENGVRVSLAETLDAILEYARAQGS